MIDAFHKAAADARLAVATFLPSLTPHLNPAPARPAAPPPHPAIADSVRALSLASKVESMSRRVARGLPPEEPKTSPQEQFPGELDPVHIRALQAAIASHPESQRAALIHEIHENLTKWIASKNGQVVIDGRLELAQSPTAAESLAQKIINGAVEEHDQRQQTAAEAAQPQPETSSTQPPTPPVGSIDDKTGRVVTHPSDDLKTAQRNATAAAPDLKKTLKRVASQVPEARVEGVRDKKDTSRTQEKVDEDGKPVNTMPDLLAGRIAVDSPEAKEQAVQAIKDQAPVIDEENKFQEGDPEYGYRSHDLQVVLPNQSSAEVQVVPEEIADADKTTHETYEEGRAAEIAGDDQAAQQAKDKNKAAHDAAMEKFNQRNGLDQYDIAGEPIKVGSRMFLPVRVKDANQGNAAASEAADSQPNRAARSAEAYRGAARGNPADRAPATGDNSRASAVQGSVDSRTAQDVSPRQVPQKGQTVTLKDGTQATVEYIHPNLNIARVNVDGKHLVIPASDLA